MATPRQQVGVECPDCFLDFANAGVLAKHRKGAFCKGRELSCSCCSKSFSRVDNLRRHEMQVHGKNINNFFACGICESVFRTKEMVQLHRRRQHEEHSDFRVVDSAHGGQVQRLRVTIPHSEAGSPDRTFFFAFDQLLTLAQQKKEEFNVFKMCATLHLELARHDERARLTEVKVFPFRSYATMVALLTSKAELQDALASMVGDFERSLNEFLNQGSGWCYSAGMFLECTLSQCLPLAGRSCGLHTAVYSKESKAVTAINNSNNEAGESEVGCFYQAVAAHFVPRHSWDRPGALSKYARRNFCIDAERRWEMAVGDIGAFEKENAHLNLSIVVLYCDEDGEVIPVRGRHARDKETNVTLLLFFKEAQAKEQPELHYAYAAHPEKLLAKRLRQDSGKLQTSSVYLCYDCFSVQSSRSAYDNHRNFCTFRASGHDDGVTGAAGADDNKSKHPSLLHLPRSSHLCFQSNGPGDPRLSKSPFVLFFDFEALQVPPSNPCSCTDDERELTELMEDPEFVAELQLQDAMLEGEYVEAEEAWREAVEELGPYARRRPRSSEFAPRRAAVYVPPPRPCPEEAALGGDAQDLEAYLVEEEALASWDRQQEERALQEVMLAAEAADAFDDCEERRAELLCRRLELSDIGQPPPLGGKKLREGDFFKPRLARKLKMCLHRTHVLREQPPFAYSLLLVDRDYNVLHSSTRVSPKGDGEELGEDFVNDVLDLAEEWLPSLSPGTEMCLLTPKERVDFEIADTCYLCEERFLPDGVDYKVRDHDHLSGKFLGAAHNTCNLQRRENTRLTCFAHNFSGYDSHFIVRALNRLTDRVTNISAIPLSTQKFKAIYVNDRVRFLDSAEFLKGSLETLVATLRKSNSTFPFLSYYVREIATGGGESEEALAEMRELLLRKGVYPYSFATSVPRLDEATELPPIEDFYNDLQEEECSEEDYLHATKVFHAFELEHMMEYTKLYVESDVFLLADVVMAFRDMMFSSFGLDICSYLSLPHITQDIMLKETGVKIEHIHDVDMALHLKSSIRGGLSYVNLRYARRTGGDGREEQEGKKGKGTTRRRRRRKEEEDEKEEKSCLLYLDVNALYSRAMQHALPLSDLEWMTADELASFDAEWDAKEDGETGYILTVDLEYPEHLHLSHNGYPLAAESREIGWDALSPYSAEALFQVYGKKKHTSRKLTATFHPRKRYTLHALNLRYYLQAGLRLKKIHCGIKFHQKAFLAPFIDMCVRRRREAKTKVEANMWKDVGNGCFGKFIESIEKRMDCRFNRTEDRALANTTSPLYVDTLICGEDLSITFHRKKKIELKQSWAVGFCILEISKYIMQRLYYDVVRPALGEDNVSLMMSDTDSFLLHVRGRDEGQALRVLSDAGIMDFSNLSPDHELFDDTRAKEPGLLKSEVSRASIAEAACIKSKTYALRVDRHDCPHEERTEGDDRVNRAKAVKKGVKDRLDFGEYKRCLESMCGTEVKQKTLRSKNHVNQLVQCRRLAFSSFDDKRYQLCAVHSVPYGSKIIAKSEALEACYYCHLSRPGLYN